MAAATDELLHLQSREDRADPALRVEPTKLPLVLQVIIANKSSLFYSEFSLLINMHVLVSVCCSFVAVNKPTDGKHFLRALSKVYTHYTYISKKFMCGSSAAANGAHAIATAYLAGEAGAC